MKTLIFIALLALTFSGCKPAASKSTETANTASTNNNTTTAANDQQASYAAPAASSEILGSYVGAFGDNKITLLITKADSGTISGRSIVGGNDRPFDGTFTFENGVYNVVAKEPGDHKDDGVFTFSITEDHLDAVNGKWQANDTKRPEKQYTLERKAFKYRTDVGVYPQASQRLLKASDVEDLVKDELSMMRNEIFARHGYCFSRKEMRQVFESEDWYIPNTVDVKNLLTDVEKKNIALIKRYEKYADDYGDEYGR